jgi:hypothetical protein
MVFKLNNDNNRENKGKSFNPFKMLGMMGACCLLPILLVGILPLLNLNASGNFFLSGVSSLICPIMMVVMMLMMMRSGKKHSCCSENKEEIKKEIQ